VIIAWYTFFLLVLSRASLGSLLEMSRYGQGLTLGAVLNVLALLLAVAAIFKRHRPPLLVPALIWLPYLTIVCCSLTYTPDAVAGARLSLSILTFPAMFISAFVLLRSDFDTIAFFKCVVYSSIVPVLYGIIQLATNGPGFRVNATFSHANIFAFYLVAVLVAILYHNILAARVTSPAWRYFSRIYFVVLCGMLLATQTRSAWIEAAFIFVAYAVSVNRKFLLALPLIPLLMFLPIVADRSNDWNTGHEVSAADVSRGEVVLGSYAWRQMLWRYALIDSQDDRVLGKGVNAFQYYSPHFFPLAGVGGIDAHSAYIQALYELGIPGLVTYITIYLGLILAVWRLRRADRRLTNLIIVFIVGNLTINYSDNLPYYLDYNWYCWMILGADLSWRWRRLLGGDRVRSAAQLPPAHQGAPIEFA
jgi:putative inorganic carbon (hco3(-)) transporter